VCPCTELSADAHVEKCRHLARLEYSPVFFIAQEG
jgi:hypothetical protein